MSDGLSSPSARRTVPFGASGDRPNAASDLLMMHTGRSFCSRTGGLLAAVGIAVTAACSADSTSQKSGPTTVPVPSVSFGSAKLDHAKWQKLWSATPGSAARRCVKVKNRTDVRSNSFIVGNFRAYRDQWDGTIENSKLYYIPLYPERTAPSLAVSAEPLDGRPTDPPIVERGSDDYAWGLPNGPPFYARDTLLAHRGRWRLIATGGRN